MEVVPEVGTVAVAMKAVLEEATETVVVVVAVNVAERAGGVMVVATEEVAAASGWTASRAPHATA